MRWRRIPGLCQKIIICPDRREIQMKEIARIVNSLEFAITTSKHAIRFDRAENFEF
jgi:hypothetical protein